MPRRLPAWPPPKPPRPNSRRGAAQDSAASALASLPDVDFSVGKEAFISTWSQRIDAYLSGSPLAGQGVTFATAAWEYGVDPRWSPAISNTESSKGAVCFKPYNAWGWGQSSLGELGRGHQRPCGRTCERLRILNHVRCGDEVLPAELRPLVQRDAGPDADDLNVSPAAGPAKLFSASEPMMPACL